MKLSLLAAACAALASASEPTQTSVILLGATGDLSRKYLWQGLFTLFVNNRSPDSIMHIVAGARDAPEKGIPKVQGFLDTRLNCGAPDISVDLSDNAVCEKAMTDFKASWEYLQLKKDNDYANLDVALKAAAGDRAEAGRLFYLSVPPFAYEQISSMVKTNAMAPEGAWTRVVLEKPFGSDLKSAQELAASLSNYFEEEEMYRVDHYLGKPGVNAIEEFRYANRQYDALFHRDHVERVDIFMKETDDCKGRTGFYDAYGVLRDVHQNHLTQMAVLVGMELASPDQAANSTVVQQLKDNVLRDMNVLSARNAVTGQYANYLEHVHEDDDSKTATNTPTWAAVQVKVDNARWRGVPFTMVAGKQLDERAAYVRVVFKKNRIVVPGTAGRERQQDENSEIIFHVQGGEFGSSKVLVSHSLPAVSFEGLQQFSPLPEALTTRFQGASRSSTDAYTTLIASVYHAQRDRFVATYNLLRSWEIWTPLLQSLGKPRTYHQPLADQLDVVLEEDGAIRFATGDTAVPRCAADQSFRGSPLRTGSTAAVVATLAQEISEVADAAVAATGSFHLALSGGSSPLKLFAALAGLQGFPWTHTHIWQVDERCVAASSLDNNFLSLSQHLLALVGYIPHNQVHPMLVEVPGRLGFCDDDGWVTDRLYDSALNDANAGVLDFIVLGMGGDAHTASLFPNAPALTQQNPPRAQFTEAPAGTAAAKRVSLSLPTINAATHKAVLVLGAGKKTIMSELRDTDGSSPALPITMVSNPTWFVDDAALA